jgi:hypothetical protein
LLSSLKKKVISYWSGHEYLRVPLASSICLKINKVRKYLYEQEGKQQSRKKDFIKISGF